MSIQLGHIVAQRHGRTVAIQPYTDDHYYQALRIFGVRPAVAAAAAKGLITITLKAST